MKIGDLVKVKKCPTEAEGFGHLVCYCFFCVGRSNRIGLVTGPASRNRWAVMFDCGEAFVDEFEVARGEVQVINV
jgi:hypothetical protein